MTDKIAARLAESKRVEEAAERCAWCDIPATGEARNVGDLALHPSCGQANHGYEFLLTEEGLTGYARTSLPRMRRALEAVLEQARVAEAVFGSRARLTPGDVRRAIESALAEEED